MNSIVSQVCEKDSVIDSILSSRSALYSLEPIGVGTPYVESLSSYISRLAREHNMRITTFLKEVIGPNMEDGSNKDKQLLKGVVFRNYLMNGTGKMSMEYISTLEKLTGRTDIRHTTMLNWKGIISKNIVTENRRWCPLCLNSLKENNSIVYEPLIWLINDIATCDKHKITLQDQCPTCNKKSPFVSSNLILGHCPYCMEWLGNSRVVQNLDDDKFAMSNYKELLKEAPNQDSLPIKLNLSYKLSIIMEKLDFNSITKFADFLEIKQLRLNQWINNKSFPSPEGLLHIAKKLNVNIYELFSYEDFDEIIYSKKKTSSYNTKRNRYTCVPVVEMGVRLKEALIFEVPESLKKVCEKGGFSERYAKNHFPELCDEIKSNYKIHQMQCLEQKRDGIACILQEIIKQEVPKSLKENLDEYGVSIRMAQKYHPDLCKTIISRYEEYIHNIKKERIDNYTEELEKIIIDLHNRDIYPSIAQINKEISNPNIFMDGYFRELRKEMLSSLGY